MRREAILAVALLGCGGLSGVELAKIHSAAQLSAMGYAHYAHQEAGTPGAALDRGAFCASNSVLRDFDAALDGGIVCQ